MSQMEQLKKQFHVSGGGLHELNMVCYNDYQICLYLYPCITEDKWYLITKSIIKSPDLGKRAMAYKYFSQIKSGREMPV